MGRPTILYLLLPLIATSLLLGCVQEEKTQPEEVAQFTPPEDGKITPARAEAYIKASLLLTRALKEQEKVLRDFTMKHELDEQLKELADSAFMKEHPEILKDWDELTKKWSDKEKEAYQEAGISEEEFNWIGGALTDPLNSDIQKEISKKLSLEME